MTGHGHDDLSSSQRPDPESDRSEPAQDTSDGPEPDDGDGTSFRSAEQWLAEQGIERKPIRVRTSSPEAAPEAEAAPGPAPSTREVAQLATEAPPVIPGEGHDLPGPDPTGEPDDQAHDHGREPTSPGPLMDEVSRALAFIQRSTASTPASCGRLERKLRDRDVPAAAIRLALADARDQGLVDDRAFAAALVTEGREKGHAPTRLRSDLRKREFSDEVIDLALGEIGDRDPEAAAFDVAHRKARSYRNLDAETAFRRLVGYLARRGHNEHVARKVARQVVFDDREDDRVAGH